jgi:hypothetical protein
MPTAERRPRRLSSRVHVGVYFSICAEPKCPADMDGVVVDAPLCFITHHLAVYVHGY